VTGRTGTRGRKARGGVTESPPPRVAAFEGPRISVRGARTHNLRAIDLDLPRDRFIVITGPSGSGKSSFAFDTLFAEGQRRYVESLSASARHRLGQWPKPDVDLIEGLSPTVAVSQLGVIHNPRATVGSVTEILDYLRLLFARVGELHSPKSGKRMVRHTIETMIDAVLALPLGTRLSILAPVVVDTPGDHAERLADLQRRGFVRVAIDGTLFDLSESIALDPDRRHTIEVYVDRLVLKDGMRARLADALEIATELGGGRVEILIVDGERLRFSTRYTDFEDAETIPELTPAAFSFDRPAGACLRCDGLGTIEMFDPARIVPEPTAAMPEAVEPWRDLPTAMSTWRSLADHLAVPTDVRWSDLSEDARLVILEGTGDRVVAGLGVPFGGVRPWLADRLVDALEDSDRDEESWERIRRFRVVKVCPDCGGTRLRPHARMVRVGGATLPELSAMPLRDLATFVGALRLPGQSGEIAEIVLAQVRRRLAFLLEVGLDYLPLERSASALSSGEVQRIRLATQVGAALVGVTYILDEPSIGLHPRDTHRLIAVLQRLRDLGNTVVVVEHDLDTMMAADWIVDFGPGAGVHGGQVMAAGSPAHVAAIVDSPTGPYLARTRKVKVDAVARSHVKRAITIHDATGHNLQHVTAPIPLGRFTCVTGVSGSGKSSLIVDTLLPEATRVLQGGVSGGLPHGGITGLEHLDKVIHVDASPIGRSGRSNPATFTGILAELRTLFASLPEARVRGYAAARFSFNVRGGRCEACQGEGTRRIEMHFLPDLMITCEVCAGRRYNRETLAIELKGKSIADVLALTIAEAYDFFVSYPAIRSKLEVLRDVGLGYMTLGQRGSSLSGGEAQRLKLGRELARKSTGRTLFILDEPTSGLHFGDVELLIAVLQRIVDEGNTVVVIEHDLDVIRAADHIVDLGPEGGDRGGQVVAVGPPQDVANVASSHTGRYLAR